MSTQAGTLVKLYEACCCSSFFAASPHCISCCALSSGLFWVQSSSGWPKAGIWACGFACCFPETNANSPFSDVFWDKEDKVVGPVHLLLFKQSRKKVRARLKQKTLPGSLIWFTCCWGKLWWTQKYKRLFSLSVLPVPRMLPLLWKLFIISTPNIC